MCEKSLCVYEKRPVKETNERDGFKTHRYRGASLESAICVATNVSKEAYMYKKRPIKETNKREVSKRLNTFELCLSQHHVCALLALFKFLRSQLAAQFTL